MRRNEAKRVQADDSDSRMKQRNVIRASLLGLLLSGCHCPEAWRGYECGGGGTLTTHGTVARNQPGPASTTHATSVEHKLRPACELPGLKPTLIPGKNSLSVVPRCQEGYYSCWSACAEMILQYLDGADVRQCDQSNQSFQRLDCCGGHHLLVQGPHCDTAWFPDFEQWGYDYRYRPDDPLSWTEITGEISAGRPFAFSWSSLGPNPTGTAANVQEDEDAVSHLMVVIAYDEDPKQQTRALTCLDPAAKDPTAALIITYEEYTGEAGSHKHVEDFWNIRPK